VKPLTTPREMIAHLQRENAELRAHAERLGGANDRLVVENAALRADAIMRQHLTEGGTPT